MKQFIFILFICLIVCVYGKNGFNFNISQQTSLNNLLTGNVNSNLNFAIENAGNSIQQVSGLSSFDISQESKEMNLNFDQKFSFENNEENSLKLPDENVHIIDLYEINETLLVDVLFKLPEFDEPELFQFHLNSDSLNGAYMYGMSAYPKGLNTNYTTCSYFYWPWCNGSIQLGSYLIPDFTIMVIENNAEDKYLSRYTHQHDNIAGLFDLTHYQDKLPSDMWTIYNHGNDSKLTLGGKDTKKLRR